MATMSVDLSLPPAKAQFLAKEAPNEEKFCIASMLFAAESGDMEELNMLLEFGMNPNVLELCVPCVCEVRSGLALVRDGYGRTPLHLAAWMGHVEVVEKLLEHPKCMINALDAHQRTPLGLAVLEQRYSKQSIKDGKQEVAAILRKRGGRRAALPKKEYPSGPA
ncbi:unnamed protein product [Durusdinium trenchii]|uniref:Uncharacterized protein n=1 Tax=Durusdinium trenchii TaxID=1381693 RepID=A0ABP0I070_9DINO